MGGDISPQAVLESFCIIHESWRYPYPATQKYEPEVYPTERSLLFLIAPNWNNLNVQVDQDVITHWHSDTHENDHTSYSSQHWWDTSIID